MRLGEGVWSRAVTVDVTRAAATHQSATFSERDESITMCA